MYRLPETDVLEKVITENYAVVWTGEPRGETP